MPHYRITTERIIGAVSEHFGITPEDMRSKSRKAPLPIARKFAWHFIMVFCPTTLRDAGFMFGLDHATAYTGVKTLRGWMATDRSMKEEETAIRTRILFKQNKEEK